MKVAFYKIYSEVEATGYFDWMSRQMADGKLIVLSEEMRVLIIMRAIRFVDRAAPVYWAQHPRPVRERLVKGCIILECWERAASKRKKGLGSSRWKVEKANNVMMPCARNVWEA